MTIDWMDEYGEIKLDFDFEKVANEVIGETLDFVSCPYEATVEIQLTDNAHIKEINRDYREIDKATDVLSFPMTEYPIAGDFSHLAEKLLNGADYAMDAFDPDSGELILGNIIISKDKVLAQANEYGHSKIREFAFLIVHSVLHLIGYDHLEENERIQMEQIQDEILTKAGYTR